MDFNALLAPVIAFFSEGIGKAIFDFAQMLYSILYPANAEAAYPVETPK
ncbi:hypothetical protein SAMN04488535_1490 [Corynebacterium mycetoides]|uniref:Uncharacterized protein n=1 Tax=Corynebacterium mycetoides TaxID=38302 RepID=A0A1G9PK04_9CORY|nr:hypothetical protein [Corynebacterium mycetoides]SDL99148.1 hypothetical protein SAMN04488535_1490 [Corynebacterium mycetoides]